VLRLARRFGSGVSAKKKKATLFKGDGKIWMGRKGAIEGRKPSRQNGEAGGRTGGKGEPKRSGGKKEIEKWGAATRKRPAEATRIQGLKKGKRKTA